MQITMRRFLHDIVAEVLGLPGDKVIWSNQDGAKLAVPFASLTTYSHQAEAMEDKLNTDEPGVLELKVPTAFVLEVRYFDDKKSYPVDTLDNFVRCLEKPTVVDKCFQNGVAFLYADPVQDITALLENNQQFEPAAAVDLHCRFTGSVTDETGFIDTVEIHGSYDDGGSGDGSGQGGDSGQGGSTGPTDGSRLIYGHIAADGTVSDLERSIPVDLSASIAEHED